MPRQRIPPRPTQADSRLTRACLLLLSLFIVYGALVPFHFAPDRAFAVAKLSRVPLNPFVSPETGLRVSIPDLIQNMLLYAPFGFLGVDVLRRRRLSAASRVLWVTVMAGLLSALAETLQLFTVDRVTSVSDLVANTAGALAGALSADVFFSRAVNWPSARLRPINLAAAPAFYPFVVAAVVLCVAAWEPFDVSLDASGIWHKLTALWSKPWQVGVPGDEGLEFLRYLLFTVLARSWLRQLGVRAPDTMAVMVGVCAALALEGSQIVIESRMPGLEDASVHVAGVLAGAVLIRSGAASRVHSPWVWCAILGLATWIGMAVQLLSPFTLAPQRRPFEWGSFSSEGQPVLGQLIELALMCFPVGFSIPLIVQKRSPILLGAVAAGFVLTVPLEYLQGWIVGQQPSVMNVGVAIVGCLAGAWVGGSGWAIFRSNNK